MQLSFSEKINVSKAKYLLSLTDQAWGEDIFTNDEIDQDGNEYTQEQYIKNAKIWLKKVIKNKGEMKTQYKYSNYMVDKGRIYIKKFGIQSLQKDLRGFLCSDDYIDLDMKNAHPTILYYIRNKFFKDIEIKFLDAYINKRDYILNKFNINKVDILKILNSEWTYKGKNEFLKNLDFEFKKLQTAIYDSKYFNDVSKINLKSKNKKGSFINRVLCVYENSFLQEAIKKIKCVDVPFFDGFFIRKNNINNIDEILKILNNNEYNIMWVEKSHSNKIQIEEIENLNLDPYEDEYIKLKKEFEKNHFMIKQPLLFVEYEDNEYIFYKESEFKIITAFYQFEEDGKKKNFFNEWKKDETRRQYSKMDFIPDNEQCPEKIFNLFKGFQAEYIEESKRIDTNLFYELIDLLTNYRADAKNYLLCYLSHIFQHAAESPKTAILFKGIEGSGKDLMLSFIKNIIGYNYILDANNLNQIMGKFNNQRSQKLIINMSELSGKQGYELDNLIKDFITADHHTVEKKGIDTWNEKNYIRLFFTSNGDNVLKLSPNNRRITVFHTAAPREKEFYNSLGQCLEDKNFLNSLYSEFMDYKINLPVNKIFITPEAKQLQELNINPLYLFVFEYFKNRRIEAERKDIIYYSKKDKNIIYLRNFHFIEVYEKFLSECPEYGLEYSEKVGYKKLKLELSKIGIKHEVKKINGTVYRCYMINLDDDFKLLKSYYDWDNFNDEEIEEI
jgi:hypothetical protein